MPRVRYSSRAVLQLLTITMSATLVTSMMVSCGGSTSSTNESKSDAGTSTSTNQKKDDTPSPTSQKMNDTITTMTGLRYIIQEEGKGEMVQPGMKVKVDYAGYLTDGTIFDTSIEEVGMANDFDRGGYPFEPIEFVVGEGNVIRGWDEGLLLMHVGDRRRLIIPPDLGYGRQGSPPVIPPNATLIFDVHLLEAKLP